MFFRFAGALLLFVLVSLFGIALEKETLSKRRQLSHQNYQLDVLRETHARLRLDVESIGSPQRTIGILEEENRHATRSVLPSRTAARPVLRWQRHETRNR